jgi:hypothetical protein
LPDGCDKPYDYATILAPEDFESAGDDNETDDDLDDVPFGDD